MKKSKNEQSYRASVGVIIIDDKYNFLLVKLLSETKDKYDFVKGGMKVQENYEDTIKREISVINFYKKEKIRIEIQKNISN
ncbi:NUDIX hydrolase [Candidatus Gracilibacteria bacterium]|nr:MAG: NUDIX hydrolase [Candidatus Gracilibacteria bacterium]